MQHCLFSGGFLHKIPFQRNFDRENFNLNFNEIIIMEETCFSLDSSKGLVGKFKMHTNARGNVLFGL